MVIADPKIREALALVRQYEAASKACSEFLKANACGGSDPIMLKIWVAEQLAHSPITATSAETAPANAPIPVHSLHA